MEKYQYKFSFAIYDPAHRKDGSYWQWSSDQITPMWESAVALIHQGWPVKSGGLDHIDARCYGVLEGVSGRCWLYRVYPAGRDSFGRPGRYFVVLFQPSSICEVTLREVAGILNYFENERSLPLKTGPLDLGLPDAEPNAVLKKLAEHWSNGGHSAHWGMDESGSVIEFATTTAKSVTPSTALPSILRCSGEDSSKREIKRKRKFITGLMIGLVAGFFIGRQTISAPNSVSRSNKSQKSELRAIESSSSPPEFNVPSALKNYERSDPKGRLEQAPTIDKRNERADEPSHQNQTPAPER